MRPATTFAIVSLPFYAVAIAAHATTMTDADATEGGTSNIDSALNLQPIAGCNSSRPHEARGGGWKLPKRPGGRPGRSLAAAGESSLHPIADALVFYAQRTGFKDQDGSGAGYSSGGRSGSYGRGAATG